MPLINNLEFITTNRSSLMILLVMMSLADYQTMQ